MKTLGYHRDVASNLFGENSQVVALLDVQIKLKGRDAPFMLTHANIDLIVAEAAAHNNQRCTR